LRARNLYTPAEGSIGVCGTLTTDAGAPAISDSDSDSDCVIVFGASLNTWTTAHKTMFRGKAVVYVDADEQRAAAPNAPVDVAIHADAAETARTFIRWLNDGEVAATPFRDRVCQGIGLPDLRFEAPLGTTVTVAGVLSELGRMIPASRTVVYDGGRFQGEALKYMCAPDYRGEVLSTAFGAIGMGMGAAIGAACAAGDEPTVFATGDGGFMMNGLAELHSAVRADVPLIIVICNDGSCGAEYDQFVHKSLSPALSLFTWPSSRGGPGDGCQWVHGEVDRRRRRADRRSRRAPLAGGHRCFDRPRRHPRGRAVGRPARISEECDDTPERSVRPANPRRSARSRGSRVGSAHRDRRRHSASHLRRTTSSMP
jgi:acetolactate synthase-1/2/3 large subunit